MDRQSGLVRCDDSQDFGQLLSHPYCKTSRRIRIAYSNRNTSAPLYPENLAKHFIVQTVPHQNINKSAVNLLELHPIQLA